MNVIKDRHISKLKPGQNETILLIATNKQRLYELRVVYAIWQQISKREYYQMYESRSIPKAIENY